MVTQSRAKPVPLLLTRPEAQGEDFANELRARFGPTLQIIKTPLLAPRFFAPPLPVGRYAALILTSQTGVEGYVRLGAATNALPKDVFCVGERTAKAARDAHLYPRAVADDAASLIRQITELRPAGPLLHLRGREARGNIRFLLDTAGIETVETVIYAQEQQALSAAAEAVLRKQNPVLVPLFSPRTAAIFVGEMARMGGISPLFLAAMSGEVALEAATISTQIKTAAKPNAASMIDALVLLLAEMKRA